MAVFLLDYYITVNYEYFVLIPHTHPIFLIGSIAMYYYKTMSYGCVILPRKSCFDYTTCGELYHSMIQTSDVSTFYAGLSISLVAIPFYPKADCHLKLQLQGSPLGMKLWSGQA